MALNSREESIRDNNAFSNDNQGAHTKRFKFKWGIDLKIIHFNNKATDRKLFVWVQ